MTEKDNSNCCILCKTKIIDELNYGPLYSERNIAAHLYCLVRNLKFIFLKLP